MKGVAWGGIYNERTIKNTSIRVSSCITSHKGPLGKRFYLCDVDKMVSYQTYHNQGYCFLPKFQYLSHILGKLSSGLKIRALTKNVTRHSLLTVTILKNMIVWNYGTRQRNTPKPC